MVVQSKYRRHRYRRLNRYHRFNILDTGLKKMILIFTALMLILPYIQGIPHVVVSHFKVKLFSRILKTVTLTNSGTFSKTNRRRRLGPIFSNIIPQIDVILKSLEHRCV